jgi:hypothetical protein
LLTAIRTRSYPAAASHETVRRISVGPSPSPRRATWTVTYRSRQHAGSVRSGENETAARTSSANAAGSTVSGSGSSGVHSGAAAEPSAVRNTAVPGAPTTNFPAYANAR